MGLSLFCERAVLREKKAEFDLSRASCALAAAMLATIAVPTSVSASANQQVLRLEVRAEIAGRCGVSASAASSSIRVDEAQSLTVPFSLDCNEPFLINVRSRNGALVRDGHEYATDQAGFRTARTYAMQLRVNTDRGLITSNTCTSEALTAHPTVICSLGGPNHEGFSSGDAIAVDQQGEVAVQWPEQEADGARFAAGDYSDVLIIEVKGRV